MNKTCVGYKAVTEMRAPPCIFQRLYFGRSSLPEQTVVASWEFFNWIDSKINNALRTTLHLVLCSAFLCVRESCLYQPEASIRYLPPWFSIFFSFLIFSFSFLFSFWGQIFHWTYSWQIPLDSLANKPQILLDLPPQYCRCVLCTAFYLGPGDPNLGSHIFPGSTLLTKPSLQSMVLIPMCWIPFP